MTEMRLRPRAAGHSSRSSLAEADDRAVPPENAVNWLVIRYHWHQHDDHDDDAGDGDEVMVIVHVLCSYCDVL